MGAGDNASRCWSSLAEKVKEAGDASPLPWWDHRAMDVMVELGARTNKTFPTLDKLKTKNGQAKKSLFLTATVKKRVIESIL